MGTDQVTGVVGMLRRALAKGDTSAVADLAAQLATARGQVSPTGAQDLLERAATFGPIDALDAIWGAFGGDFPLAGWALALALRCANEDVARELLSRGVDLLGPVRRPSYTRGLMPHEGTFTRFALTRESPTLFLNNMDPTVSTAVFEPFRETDCLAAPAYATPVDLTATCDLVVRLASEGLFDVTTFDDLLRAAAVRAWHALRHARERDEEAAATCLSCARRLVDLHRRHSLGDRRVDRILGNLVVPRADQALVAFACEVAPEAFLGRLAEADWLQGDVDLVASMVPHLKEGLRDQPAAGPDGEGRAELAVSLAQGGKLPELKEVCSWPAFADTDILQEAMVASSQAGHAEAAAWLLARLQEVDTGAAPQAPGATAEDESVPESSLPGAAARNQTAPLSGLDARVLQKGRSKAQIAMPEEDTAGTGNVTGASEGETEGNAYEELTSMALEVVTLSRADLVAKNPFLATAASTLVPTPVQPGSQRTALATDGQALLVDPTLVLEGFHATRQLPTHDMAHVLAHCILLHPFVGTKVRAREWDLAADLVAEEVAAELLGPREGQRGREVAALVSRVARTIDGRLTTERLYRALRQGAFTDEREDWPALLRVDDHLDWYPEDAAKPQPSDSSSAGGEGDDGGRSPDTLGREGGSLPQDERPGEDREPDDASQDEQQDDGEGGSAPSPEAATPRATPTDAERAAAQDRWEHLAKSVRVDLETLSRARGSQLSGLTRELEVAAHDQMDYRDFLRQFATSSEEVHLSDDEFDYVFYTYGLETYGNMPLIEPLEYRSERRIHDFAIVIDTSSSVTLPVVQQFVDTTFDVLTSEASFSDQINVHIIQADQRVQSDTRLTSLADLDRWRHAIKLRGFGGTDFRPAFRYVVQLQQEGEFDDLRGLIYFTDGWGIYPEAMPPFPTTFVFYDEDHRPDLVPAWALQITLHPGEAESMSVY